MSLSSLAKGTIGMASGTNLLGWGSAGIDTYMGLQAQKQARKQFNAQMDTSIQRRVADAKKAGIHPLFAMGASVGASPTMSVTSDSGNIGRSIRGAARGISEAALMTANVKNAEGSAARNHAEALLANARRKLLEQEFNHSGRDKLVGSTYGQYPNSVPPGTSVTVPNEITSAKPGRPSEVAGPAAPLMQKYTWNGMEFFLPKADNPAESFENIGGIAAGLVYTLDMAGTGAVNSALKFLKRAGFNDWKRLRSAYYRLKKQPKKRTKHKRQHQRANPTGFY